MSPFNYSNVTVDILLAALAKGIATICDADLQIFAWSKE